MFEIPQLRSGRAQVPHVELQRLEQSRSRPGDNYEATRSMRDRLMWKAYRPGSELLYLDFPEAKRDENAWAARSPIPFRFLFGNLPRLSRTRQSKARTR